MLTMFYEKNTMGLIEIEGMHFYAYHGHFETEQIVGNDFIVDLQMNADCDKAAISDNLDDALNYQAVYLLVKKEMAIKSRLLEHVAKRILDALFNEFPNLEKAKVKVSKLNPPMGGEIKKVSVTLSR